MRNTAFPDLFELEPSTAAYVPRRATVEVLAQLQSAIEHDEPVALLRGPPGIGKTLMLRLLRRRIEGRMSCIALEASGQTCDALCAAALRALGREPDGAPVEELARAALERGRAGVLLMIDRAEALTPEILAPLIDLAARCPALQVVLAAETPAIEHAWLDSPDPRISLIEFDAPMSARETIEYLVARLDLAVAPPEARRALGWRSWLPLIRESQGNPALLHHLVRRRLAGESAGEPPALLRERAQPLRPLVPWRWVALGGSALALVIALAFLALRPQAEAPAALALEPPLPSAQRAPETAPKPATAPAAPAPAPASPAPPAVAEPEPSPRIEPAPPAAPAGLPSVEAAPRSRTSLAQPAPRPAPERKGAPKPAVARPAPRRAVEPPLGAGDALADLPRLDPAEVRASIPVFVNAVPAARIAIDGRDVGNTPIVGLLIPEGSRSFVASFSDGRQMERKVEVEGAEVYVLFP